MAVAPRILSRNGFSKARAKVAAGQSATVLISSDSTGNCRDNAGRWPAKFAAQLAATYPTHTVNLINWNTTAGNAWDAPTVIATGSTSAKIDVWNFAVSGTVPHYGMGSTFATAFAPIAADGLIINHGINFFPGWDVAGQDGASVRGALFSLIQQYTSLYPDCPVSGIVQNPNQASNLLDNMPIFWKQVRSLLDIGLVTDIYDSFITAGKPLSYYVNGDPVHMSEPIGNQIYADAIWAHWQAAAMSNLRGKAPTLITKGKNLLTNGGFTKWTNPAIAPDGWTSGGTIIFTKDTAVFADPDFGYSVKMEGSGAAQTYIRQEITDTTILARLKGKKLTFAVRKRVGVSGANSVGRLGVIFFYGSGQSTTFNSVTYILRQDDFDWWCFQGMVVPDTVTSIRVNLHQDSAATPDASNPVWFDQVSLAVGEDMVLARA